jgi:nitroreductase
MKQLTTLQNFKVLEAGLEFFHQQSHEWLDKISLWVDEYDAFFILIINMTDVPQKYKAIIDSKEQELFKKTLETELKDLKLAIVQHENQLAEMLKTDQLDEASYRKKHLILSVRIDQFDKKYIKLKQEILQLLKLVQKETSRNEVLKTIYERRAVRSYKSKSIPLELIEKIIDAGKMAPSAMNHQPWKFYVLTDSKLISKFSRSISKIVAKEIFKTGIKKLAKSIGTFNLANGIDFIKAKDPIFHGAPVVMFLTAPKENEWAALDIGMCAQNIMLAAKSMGLDSCPVGFGKFVMQTDEYPGLKIPSSEQVLLTVVLGYGSEVPTASPRNTKTIIYL